MAHPAYVWDGRGRAPSLRWPPRPRPCCAGVDRQKQQVVDNVQRLAAGHAAHDMLLWGARGMGKSALIRASVRAAQLGAPAGIALVQVVAEALGGLARLFGELGRQQRNFLTYIDDLGFAEDDSAGPRQLRSWLEGGVEARPANVRLAVTSNRRAIVPRHGAEQDDPINPRDAVDDRLALADRFGLSIGFHNCTQDDYLAIIAGYADEFGLEWDEGEALEWAKRRGARSGRTAWQYITEIAGRAGQTLPA
ncbi:MAG: ATP-binding protein [Caenibius sp.]